MTDANIDLLNRFNELPLWIAIPLGIVVASIVFYICYVTYMEDRK